MNSKYFYFIGFVIFLFSCTNITTQHTKLDSNITLPFFNKPDWTPEWVAKTDSNYNQIHRIPKFSFLNQAGEVVTEKTVANKIYVANFFFTTCRGICPKMTTNMNLLQQAFVQDSNVLFLSHSVTPETDNQAVLNKYAIENKINNKQWHLLTGNKDEIYKLAKQQYFAGDSVGYYQTGNEFLHTENFILIDKHSRIRGVYNGTLLVEIDRIKEDIALLKKED